MRWRRSVLREIASIITLLLKGDDGNVGAVPKLIDGYAWKAVEPIEVIRVIVDALPIRAEGFTWR